MQRDKENAVAVVRRCIEGRALEELDNASRFVLDDVRRTVRQGAGRVRPRGSYCYRAPLEMPFSPAVGLESV